MAAGRYWFGILGLAAMAATGPARAQADAFVQASRNCASGSVALDKRLANCMTVVKTQGLDPADMAVAYVNLGIVYRQQHNDDAALAAYTKALGLQPTLWQALVDRGFLYLTRGDIDLALADYKAVAATDPDDAVLTLPNKGEYRPVIDGVVHNSDSPERDQDARSTSIAKLRDAVAASLSDRCRMGATKPNGFDNAMVDCSAALAIAPNFPPALISRGFAEFVHGDYRAAAADLEASPPNRATLIYLRGVAKRRYGEKSQGDLDIAAAEKLTPGITTAMSAQGVAP